MQRGFLREHGSVVVALYSAADFAAIVVGCLCGHMLRFGNFDMPPSYGTALIIGLLLALGIFPRFNLYESWRGRPYLEQMRRILLAWITVGLGLVFIAFVLKDSEKFSRLWFGYWGLCTALLLLFGRSLASFVLKILRRRGHNSRNIVIIGSGHTAYEAINRVQAAAWSGLKIACVFVTAKNEFDDEIAAQGLELRPLAEVNLEQELTERRIDEAWICMPFSEQAKIEQTLDMLRQTTVRQRIVPDLTGMKFVRYPITDILDIPMLNVSATPIQGISRLVKDIEDKLLALFFIVLSSPLLILLALAVKLNSRGPIIFKQRRHGANGQPIKVYKFRTMVVHEENGGHIIQACKNDDRVTRVGAFLRRTSLDELPQLLNVLQGRMSLVGPRPHALAHNQYYKDKIQAYMQRHNIKPGITGWAQVNGWRGETDTLEKMQKRVECDMYYIENWSLWLDLKIVFLTIFRGLSGKNAY